MAKVIHAPLQAQELETLRAGDSVLLSGTIYTGRDAAHKRLCAQVEKGEALPFDLRNQVIYYAGPCPAKPGDAIGSCGPTTSYRMDAYAPRLIERGLAVMIGKGPRGEAVLEAMRAHGAVYLAAEGGAGALLASCVEECELVAWPELGPEAVRRLIVRDMPLIAAADAEGGNLYLSGPAEYLASGGK